MTKFKKNVILMSLIGATLGSTLALSSACPGKDKNKTYDVANNKYANKRFEQANDKKVIFGVTFSKGKPQWNALENVIKEYNSQNEGKPGFLPVELKNIGSGYGAGASFVRTALNTKDKNGFVNLVANYSPVASLLAENGMLMNFEDKDKNVSTKGSDVFASEFNELTENIASVVNKGTWLLPAMKSTTALGVDGPVMGYIMKTMVEKGAKIHPNFQEKYNQIVASMTNDAEYVKKEWGEVVDDASLAKLNLSQFTISKETFSSFSNLLDFGIKAQQLFKKSSDTKNSSVHFLGIDDIAGVLENVAYSSVDADEDKYLVNKVTKNGDKLIDYTPFTRTDSEVGKNMTSIYNKIKEAIKVGALTLFGGGEYTSNYSVTHKYGLSIGSTAGYSYNFKKSGNKAYVYQTIKDGNVTAEFATSDIISAKADNDHLFTSTDDGKHWNKIYYSSDNKEEKDKAKEIGYSFFSTNEESDKKLKEYLSKTELKAGTAKLVRANDEGKVKALKDLGYQPIEGLQNAKGQPLTLFYVDKFQETKFKKVELGDNSVLNEEEFFSMIAPSKWQDANKKHVVYSQGPSIMGIHANSEEDYATKMFIKWLTSGQKYKFEDDIEETPTEHISRVASYIFPTKGYDKTDLSKIKNKYLSLAYEYYAKAGKTPDQYAIFESPADTRSDSFRESLGQRFVAVYNILKSGKDVTDYKSNIVDPVVQSNEGLFK